MTIEIIGHKSCDVSTITLHCFRFHKPAVQIKRLSIARRLSTRYDILFYIVFKILRIDVMYCTNKALEYKVVRDLTFLYGHRFELHSHQRLSPRRLAVVESALLLIAHR